MTNTIAIHIVRLDMVVSGMVADETLPPEQPQFVVIPELVGVVPEFGGGIIG